jgi:hypothetical protein
MMNQSSNVEANNVKLVTAPKQPYINIKQKKESVYTALVQLMQAYSGGFWFDPTTFFSQHLAVRENRSSNTSLQRSHRLFRMAGLRLRRLS